MIPHLPVEVAEFVGYVYGDVAMPAVPWWEGVCRKMGETALKRGSK
jgi:hypothetical protein